MAVIVNLDGLIDTVVASNTDAQAALQAVIDAQSAKDVAVAKEALISPHYTAIDTIEANKVDVGLIADHIDGTLSTDIADVAAELVKVTAVADNLANNKIQNVEAKLADISKIAEVDNLADIATVADDLNAIDANTIADITIVANDLNDGAASDINIVSANRVNINKVSAVDSNITKVAAIDTNVTKVADIDTNVTKVANITDGDVSKVADIDGDVAKVAAVDSAVSSVATDVDKGIGTNTASDSAILNALTNASDASDSATNAQLSQWAAEANKMTADSYATEAEDAYVKIWSSDGDGTFTATNTTEYSSLHWAVKADKENDVSLLIANDLSEIDTTAKKAAARDNLNVDVAGTDNSIDVTVTDSAEIDFTLTGQEITATLKTGSIDETKLDTSVNDSLDLADSALQTVDITYDAGAKTVTNTGGTEATLTVVDATNDGLMVVADKTKVDYISVTQAVDLDTMESDVAGNNNKTTNATHTGDVTGDAALTIKASVGLGGNPTTTTQPTTTQAEVDAADAADIVATTKYVIDRINYVEEVA